MATQTAAKTQEQVLDSHLAAWDALPDGKSRTPGQYDAQKLIVERIRSARNRQQLGPGSYEQDIALLITNTEADFVDQSIMARYRMEIGDSEWAARVADAANTYLEFLFQWRTASDGNLL